MMRPRRAAAGVYAVAYRWWLIGVFACKVGIMFVCLQMFEAKAVIFWLERISPAEVLLRATNDLGFLAGGLFMQ